jgi:hypothetical protein
MSVSEKFFCSSDSLLVPSQIFEGMTIWLGVPSLSIRTSPGGSMHVHIHPKGHGSGVCGCLSGGPTELEPTNFANDREKIFSAPVTFSGKQAGGSPS